MSMVNRFEEIRNENGVLYKLRGKLGRNKIVDIAVVPKSKMAYMHINDYLNSWDDGSFKKGASTFVSLSMKEADTLRNLMLTMDGHVQALVNAAPPVGKKRKTESNTTSNDCTAIHIQQIPAYYTLNGMGQQYIQSATIPPYDAQQSASAYQQAAASQPVQLQQQSLGYQPGTGGHQQPGISYQSSFGVGHQQSTAAEIQPFSTGSQQNQQPTSDLDYVTQLYATYQG